MRSEHFGPDRRYLRLARRARAGDEGARERLVRELMPVAERVARRFASAHHPAEDLTQVGGIGLLKAIERYDPTRETTFTTYAQSLMTGEVRRHIRDTRLMRVPRSIYEQVPLFQRVMDRLTGRLGRTPTRQELADALGLSKEEIIEIADAALSAQPLSLDGSLADTDSDYDLGEHDGGFEQVDDGLALAPILRKLSPRERMILELRFEEGLSQSEIGDGLGLSQTQVSRILRNALGKLSDLAPATI